MNPRQRTVKAVYKTYIDVIHFRKTDSTRLRGREEEEDDVEGEGLRKVFSVERKEQLRYLSQLKDCYERLSRALGELDKRLFTVIFLTFYMHSP